MIKRLLEFKTKIYTLGNTTKTTLKITLILVVTCLVFALFSFIIKDYSNRYIFFSNLSSELIIVARSCAVLGAVFVMIVNRIEK
jgi:hypothetical protein